VACLLAWIALALGAGCSGEATAPDVPDIESYQDEITVLTEVATGFSMGDGMIGAPDSASSEPVDPALLLECVDLPPVTWDAENAVWTFDAAEMAAWLEERLAYHASTDSCFSSWAFGVTFSNCALGDAPPISGALYVAGEAMSAVPESGLFVETLALAAAALDLAALLGGNAQLFVELDLTSADLTMAACTVPIGTGARTSSFSLLVENDTVGSLALAGDAAVTTDDDIRTATSQLDVDAELPNTAEVRGWIHKIGVQQRIGAVCPHAGQVVLGGAIDDDPGGELGLTWVGEGLAILELPDGTTTDPFTPPRCVTK
jgi:hypothetical protein